MTKEQIMDEISHKLKEIMDHRCISHPWEGMPSKEERYAKYDTEPIDDFTGELMDINHLASWFAFEACDRWRSNQNDAEYDEALKWIRQKVNELDHV